MNIRITILAATIAWISTTAAYIAIAVQAGSPPPSETDHTALISGFAVLILSALITSLSAFTLRRFEARVEAWHLVPLGGVHLVYGSSLRILGETLFQGPPVEALAWIGMSFGLMSFGLGAYLFAREARKSEGECVGASKVIPIAAWLASSAITAYSLARLFASPEWHIDAAGASALLASAISALLSALLSSGRVFSSTTAAPLHSCSFGLAMFGMYSLTHALHAATRDASLKALSQGLSVAAPSLLLVGLVLLSRHEVELLMPQRPKGVLSILFEADPLAMWPQELATYVSRRCKSMHTLLVTRPASTLAPHVRCSVIALMDPSSTYPQRLGEATYRVSPEPTHIVGLINRIKNEGAKPLCLVFDSLTDIIAMSGIKEGYRTARDVLSVLEPDDVAIFVMFPRAHKEDEVTVIRTLFTHIAKTR